MWALLTTWSRRVGGDCHETVVDEIVNIEGLIETGKTLKLPMLTNTQRLHVCNPLYMRFDSLVSKRILIDNGAGL